MLVQYLTLQRQFDLHAKVARFFLVQSTKTGQNRPNDHNFFPNGRKIDQMAIKYANIFHSKTLQNFPE
jgi:hypothetical protein